MTQTIIQILLQVRSYITDDSDMAWVRYDTPADLRAELTTCIEALQHGKTECLTRLSFHFGPTCTFQEHSISNGWGNEYLALAEAFDKAYAIVKHP